MSPSKKLKFNFNPLHHEGGDSNVQTFCRRTRDFNPLHHEGGDWESNTFPALRQDFNPLHHEGGDIFNFLE